MLKQQDQTACAINGLCTVTEWMVRWMLALSQGWLTLISISHTFYILFPCVCVCRCMSNSTVWHSLFGLIPPARLRRPLCVSTNCKSNNTRLLTNSWAYQLLWTSRLDCHHHYHHHHRHRYCHTTYDHDRDQQHTDSHSSQFSHACAHPSIRAYFTTLLMPKWVVTPSHLYLQYHQHIVSTVQVLNT